MQFVQSNLDLSLGTLKGSAMFLHLFRMQYQPINATRINAN